MPKAMNSGHLINLKIAIAGLLLVFLIPSCNNEIELYYPAEALPVVYCLLDMESDIQYLRIGKTYMGDADYTNQIPPTDSLFLPGEKDIYIEEWSDEEGVEQLWYFEFSEGTRKDSGLFPVDAVAVYESSFRPKANHSYTLYVYFPAVNKVLSAEIKTLGPTELLDPAPILVREVNFTSTRGYTLRYMTADNAGIYQGFIRIHYAEYRESGINFDYFDLTIPIRYITEKNLQITQTISPGTFFRGFSDNIQVEPDVQREVLSMDFSLYCAGEDLGYFVKAQMPTFWLNLSQYSNFDNSFGVFSSISVNKVSNIRFSILTKYQLATDSITEALNFINPYQ